MKRENTHKYRHLDSRLRGNDSRNASDSRITKNGKGFTLVEILTTIAIISILLGFLIPALSMIQKSAVTAKQKAQFHGIEIALEAFSTDTGDYPPSAHDTVTYGNYSASQRLAEAMVGQDGFGFHQDSGFYESGEDVTGLSLYMTHPDYNTDYPTQSDIDDNIAVRKGPYLELENANAVKLSSLYGSGNYGSLVDTFVLADMFKISKNAATGKLTGSPILYYRANRGKTKHDIASANIDPIVNQCTYNAYDSVGSAFVNNDSIADLVPLSTKSGVHPLRSDLDMFYKQTLNPNFTSPARPYRSESFILQSAGPDSLYGTPDDVFNFEQGN